MPPESSGFPLLRAILATTLAGGLGLGGAVCCVFVLMVALNGFSEREALPIFALFAVLLAAGTALLVAGANLLFLGRSSGGGLRFGAALALGAVTGGLQAVVSLGFLAMF